MRLALATLCTVAAGWTAQAADVPVWATVALVGWGAAIAVVWFTPEWELQ